MRVIVIGAGLLGTSTAYFLAERGHDVVVLDRARAIADETSHANGGIIHASNAAPWNAPGVVRQALRWIGRRDAPIAVRPSALPGLARWGLSFLRHSRRDRFERSLRANARLAVYSLAVMRELRDRTGLDYHARTAGCLAVFRDQAGLDAAGREAAILADAGVRSEILDRRALAAREPTLADGFAGGLLYPDDESGDACLFTRALASRARERGAEFRLATPVTRLLVENGAVTGAATPAGDFRGDACVLAAGSYSPALARPAGLRLPIYPVKGHSLTLPLPPGAPLPHAPLIDGERKVVAAVLGDRLRVAGFAEFAGYDRRTDTRRSQALLRGLRAVLPDLAARLDPATAEPWAGLRPTTPDGRPLLGPTPAPGLYLATGTGHLGWTFAAGAGRLVADAVSGAPPALALDELSYRRLTP
ncbi:D-amino acid dehydrogenase small subunit [Salinisphaera sp. PC39]|uniref:D-amino acid dehydrogenase n=1 Tax=Salinisphaera sp. PC39 TaxID=1304156 RepID=UPI00333E8E47